MKRKWQIVTTGGLRPSAERVRRDKTIKPQKAVYEGTLESNDGIRIGLLKFPKQGGLRHKYCSVWQ